MSKKSILGRGNEFGWVGSTKDDASTKKPVPKKIKKQGDVYIRKHVDKETSEPAKTKETSEIKETTSGPEKKPQKTKKVGIYLTHESVLELKMQALLEDTSLSAIIQKLVNSYLKRKNKQKQA